MCPIANWEDQKENLSNFYWREIDSGIHLGGMLTTRSVLQKTSSTGLMAIRNENNVPVVANFYFGIDPKNKQECSKATTDVIDSGQVWYGIFTIPLKARKQNKIGAHKIGLYTELRNAKQKAKKAARVALSALTGINVGKVHGISLEFNVVEANTIKCPDCGKFLVFRPLSKEKAALFWVCESCQKHWNI